LQAAQVNAVLANGVDHTMSAAWQSYQLWDQLKFVI
jgi:hypothetical protein